MHVSKIIGLALVILCIRAELANAACGPGLALDVVPLRHVDASHLAGVLQVLADHAATINPAPWNRTTFAANTLTNTLVVCSIPGASLSSGTTTGLVLDRVRQVIAQLDVQQAEVILDVRLFTLKWPDDTPCLIAHSAGLSLLTDASPPGLVTALATPTPDLAALDFVVDTLATRSAVTRLASPRWRVRDLEEVTLTPHSADTVEAPGLPAGYRFTFRSTIVDAKTVRLGVALTSCVSAPQRDETHGDVSGSLARLRPATLRACDLARRPFSLTTSAEQADPPGPPGRKHQQTVTVDQSFDTPLLLWARDAWCGYTVLAVTAHRQPQEVSDQLPGR